MLTFDASKKRPTPDNQWLQGVLVTFIRAALHDTNQNHARGKGEAAKAVMDIETQRWFKKQSDTSGLMFHNFKTAVADRDNTVSDMITPLRKWVRALHPSLPAPPAPSDARARRCSRISPPTPRRTRKG